MKKLAALSLILLMSLYSGCAKKAEPVFVPVHIARCPKQEKPELPKLGNVGFLESARAYTIIRQRDRIMRDYIAGLEASLECYESQAE